MNFKLTNSKILFEGKVFNLKVDEIEYDSGNKGIREVAVHPGGAVVVPITIEGKLVMVTQFRYPFQTTLLEFPAGKLDIDEDPLDCAVRELEEETGYKAAKVNKLGKIYTAPGYCTETLHIYVAQELKKGDHKREEGEQGMEVFELSLEEIEKKINNGEIVDAKSICGFYYLKNRM
ncbi:MAG: NUDIX hydrolase [Bacteroidetes bacterium]|nr:NUDIX hydrolase [Bacteroidota bacterium]